MNEGGGSNRAFVRDSIVLFMLFFTNPKKLFGHPTTSCTPQPKGPPESPRHRFSIQLAGWQVQKCWLEIGRVEETRNRFFFFFFQTKDAQGDPMISGLKWFGLPGSEKTTT